LVNFLGSYKGNVHVIGLQHEPKTVTVVKKPRVNDDSVRLYFIFNKFLVILV